jgi:hypothetical protein
MENNSIARLITQKELRKMFKKLTATMILGMSLSAAPIFGQSAQSQGSRQGTSDTKTLTGVVSDSMCGAKHMAKDKTAAQCTRECVQSGSDYALVVGTKMYVLKGDKAAIDKLAGERATVNGTVSGDTVTVQSIAAAKKATS